MAVLCLDINFIMVDGFGAITWWGFSPAVDLQEKYECELACIIAYKSDFYAV